MSVFRNGSVALLVAALSFGATAATFSWTSAGDILTFDIHAQNENLNSTACQAVYESLVRWDRNMKVEPSLAVSWKRVPEGFEFKLRPGVRFHEGEPFTADDVVFSYERALSPKSQFKSHTTGITGVKKIDDMTVVVLTKNGSPVLLNQMVDLRIMSKSWAQKHGALEVQDFINKQEAYVARHANGTGPFKLKSREVDVKTVFVANEQWWDQKNRAGNATEVVYMPIKSAATRTAALLSGQVDFVLDPATQDLKRLAAESNVKVLEGPENRVLMVSLDQFRDESPYIWNDMGEKMKTNPFKDRRVREALNIAVNRPGLVRGVMRGSAVATGSIVASNVNGWTAQAAAVPAYDVNRAKELLKQAGYAKGFTFSIDCPNNRWINDENVCKALSGMWAKIGIKVNVNAMPRAQFFPKVLTFDSSAGLVGWGASTFDALYPLQSLSATFDKSSGNGISNIGRVSNAKMDGLLARIRDEEDPVRRNALIAEALLLDHDEVLHIPLHEQTIPWAMGKRIDAVHRPDNRLNFDWVRIREK
jgi:peptide/nickel transport system substrate-binding protein